jgi:hypothetical protein
MLASSPLFPSVACMNKNLACLIYSHSAVGQNCCFELILLKRLSFLVADLDLERWPWRIWLVVVQENLKLVNVSAPVFVVLASLRTNLFVVCGKSKDGYCVSKEPLPCTNITAESFTACCKTEAKI